MVERGFHLHVSTHVSTKDKDEKEMGISYNEGHGYRPVGEQSNGSQPYHDALVSVHCPCYDVRAVADVYKYRYFVEWKGSDDH